MLELKVKVPEPVIEIFAGAEKSASHAQLSEQAMAQFPEPGAVQVSVGTVAETVTLTKSILKSAAASRFLQTVV